MSKDEKKESIRDIASFKTVLDDVERYRAMKSVFPMLKPFLRQFDVDVDGVEELFGSMDEVGDKMESITNVIDRFNELFADRGWISYEMLSINVTTAAVSKAEAGDWEAAEAELVGYFDAEEVRRGLRRMNAVQAFRPRMPLAWKAVEDYAANRFHACVPVVLALLDGMVNEIHQKVRGTRRGISSEGVDLSAWDSIAAHNSGLNRLVKIFQTGRRKTSDEQITLPFRNGILHGIDLGYDNRIVAAKCWAALFAAREWAIRAESGRHEAPQPEPEPTLEGSWNRLLEVTRDYEEIQDGKRRAELWKPRQLRIGVDVPRTGKAEDYVAGTPEQKLIQYLTYWKVENYGYMARSVADVFGPPKPKAAVKMRGEFGGKRLISYELESISEESYAMCVISVNLELEWNERVFKIQHAFRMICQGERGGPALPGVGASEWKVINWTFPDAACAREVLNSDRDM